MRYFEKRQTSDHRRAEVMNFGLAASAQRNCSLVSRFLTYCPSKRILSDEGLKHEYFRESPLPIDPSMFPTWPAKSEQQRVKRGTSPRPPEGGLGYSQLVSSLNSTFPITVHTCNKFFSLFVKILQKDSTIQPQSQLLPLDLNRLLCCEIAARQ